MTCARGVRKEIRGWETPAKREAYDQRDMFEDQNWLRSEDSKNAHPGRLRSSCSYSSELLEIFLVISPNSF